MSKFGLTELDVRKLEDVRGVLVDISIAHDIASNFNESKESVEISELINTAILASCNLRMRIEDILRKARIKVMMAETPEEAIIRVREAKYDRENSEYTKSMHKWMEENTND
jgi:hypothetical protein|tara:strand:- start:225 stop:560 length:336 start_codon:yes stop_codon:yes gene_type:complete